MQGAKVPLTFAPLFIGSLLYPIVSRGQRHPLCRLCLDRRKEKTARTSNVAVGDRRLSMSVGAKVPDPIAPSF